MMSSSLLEMGDCSEIWAAYVVIELSFQWYEIY